MALLIYLSAAAMTVMMGLDGSWTSLIALITGLIAFSGPIFGMNPTTGDDPVSFTWINPAALTVNLIVGLSVSWLLSRSRPTDARGATPGAVEP
jgi:hypothetical protein